MSAVDSVNGNNDSIAAQTARRAAAGAAEAASNTADGKENVNSYRNSNIKDSESDSVQISTAAQTASDAASGVAEAAHKEAAEGKEAAESGKAIADVDLTVVSKGDKIEKSEKSAALGSGAKADNKPNVTDTHKAATPQIEAKEETTSQQSEASEKAMEEMKAKEAKQMNAEAGFSILV